MCVSNEPCADKADDSRWELAHERAFDGLAVYGECRDSEQKAKRLRTCRHGSLRPTRSHARTNENTGAPSLLGSDRGLIWTYTANAATVSKRSAFANLSAWRMRPARSHNTSKNWNMPENNYIVVFTYAYLWTCASARKHV